MRYVILGAGAVGGAIGGRLFEHGHDVVLIARGAHEQALRRRGLELADPDRTVILPVPVAANLAAATVGSGDVVILATKTQSSEALLRDLALSAGPEVVIVCAQNGVENERLALRRFREVQAMCVILPATHLDPGVVEMGTAPLNGVLDLGLYPSGMNATTERIAADLSSSGFASSPDANIMASKYQKLLANLGNALQAACGRSEDDEASKELRRRARAEALACYDAAGIEVATAETDEKRRLLLGELRSVGGRDRQGSSSWQSLARGSGDIEADWLNGEIVFLGHLHGIPTPVNEVLCRTANALARAGAEPASLDAADLLRAADEAASAAA